METYLFFIGFTTFREVLFVGLPSRSNRNSKDRASRGFSARKRTEPKKNQARKKCTERQLEPKTVTLIICLYRESRAILCQNGPTWTERPNRA